MIASHCPDDSNVWRISTLIGCCNTLCVTHFSWLRCATPSGDSPVYRSGLIFGLISNQLRHFHTDPTLMITSDKNPEQEVHPVYDKVHSWISVKRPSLFKKTFKCFYNFVCACRVHVSVCWLTCLSVSLLFNRKSNNDSNSLFFLYPLCLFFLHPSFLTVQDNLSLDIAFKWTLLCPSIDKKIH